MSLRVLPPGARVRLGGGLHAQATAEGVVLDTAASSGASPAASVVAAPGAAGTFLRSTGPAAPPVWGSLSTSDIPTLPPVKLGSLTPHGIVVGDAAGAGTTLTPGETGDVLLGVTDGAPVWGALDGSHLVGAFTGITGLGALASTLQIGATASSVQTLGLRIDQGAASGEAISLGKTTVAHGITSGVDSSTYGVVQANNPTAGGVAIAGYRGGASAAAFVLAGATTGANTNRAPTTSTGIVTLVGRKAVAGVPGAPLSGENVLAVLAHDRAQLLVRQGGELVLPESTARLTFGSGSPVATLSLPAGTGLPADGIALGTDVFLCRPAALKMGATGASGGAITFEVTGTLSASVRASVGGLTVARVTKTAAYALTDADHTVHADATAGAVVITLPSAVGANGRMYRLAKVDASANAGSFATTGGQLIYSPATPAGATSYAITTRWGTATVQSDGANWIIC